MNLCILTDREIIRYADNICDDLTTTPLESELLRRFADAQPLLEVLRQYGINNASSLIEDLDILNKLDAYTSTQDLIELLESMSEACSDFDCHNLLDLFHHLMENQK